MLLRLFVCIQNKINSICDCFRANRGMNNTNNYVHNDDTNRQILDINSNLVINKEGINRKLHDVEKNISSVSNNIIIDDLKKQNDIQNDSMPFIDFSESFKILTTITEEDDQEIKIEFSDNENIKEINNIKEKNINNNNIKINNITDCIEDVKIIDIKNEIERDNIKKNLSYINNIDILKINKSIIRVQKFNVQNKK